MEYKNLLQIEAVGILKGIAIQIAIVATMILVPVAIGFVILGFQKLPMFAWIWIPAAIAYVPAVIIYIFRKPSVSINADFQVAYKPCKTMNADILKQAGISLVSFLIFVIFMFFTLADHWYRA